MASASPDQPRHAARRKRRFANAARNFAKRAVALPGFTMLTVGGAAGIVLTTVTGAFGTAALPFGQRLAFWSVLIGWNIMKWLAWFAWRVKRREDWARAGAVGAVVVNLPLAIEIPAALWLFGIPAAFDPARVWAEAGAISATLFVVLHFARPRPAPAARPADRGTLYRAGIRDAAAIHAVTAEDHYCRIHLAGGRSVLVLARFADLLAELAGADGEQVHRGAWVAAAAIDGAVRDGRAWRLVLADGARLPVSARHLATVRARGWLAIKPALGVAQTAPGG